MSEFPKSPDTRPIPHAEAYTRLRRARNALWFIREMSRRGVKEFEATKSSFVGRTYGLPPSAIRRMKARYRNELSFTEGK